MLGLVHAKRTTMSGYNPAQRSIHGPVFRHKEFCGKCNVNSTQSDEVFGNCCKQRFSETMSIVGNPC